MVRAVVLFWGIWVVAVHAVPFLPGSLWPARNPNEETDVWPYFMAAIQTSLSRWDARWFHEVVERGYFYYGPLRSTSIDYYPLYPMLVRGVRLVTHLNTFRAGTAVSALATLGCLMMLVRITKQNGVKGSGLFAIEALLYFPSAFVLATVYSDSTTLFCFLTAVYFAQTRSYVVAGVAALGAGLSHQVGWLIIVPLVVIAWQDLIKKKMASAWIMVALAVAGALVFPGFIWASYGRLALCVHGHRRWFSVPFYTFLKEVFLAVIGALVERKVPASVDPTGMSTFPANCAVLVLMFWTARQSYRRQRWPDFAFSSSVLLLASSMGTLQSLTRLALVCYPIFLRLGEVYTEAPTVRTSLSFVSAALQIVLLSLFVRWYFVF